MLIDRILARSGVTVIASPAYMGKTFLALEAMRAVAYATPFLSHFAVPRAGNVLYLGNDSPAWDIASQFDKLVGLPDPKLDDVPRLLDETALGSFGFIFDPQFMLNTAADGQRVIDAAKAHYSHRHEGLHHDGAAVEREVHGSDLIVIDTLRSVHGFDENDNTAMQHVMNLLRWISTETKASVLALHHYNKTTKESLSASLDRLRGATCIGGAVDAVFALTGKAPSIAVRVLKNRPCPEQTDFVYEVGGTKDEVTLKVAAAEGLMNPQARAAVLESLTLTGWTKTADIKVAVGLVLGEKNEKKIDNVTSRVLSTLEKAGTIIRVHGAARLAPEGKETARVL